MNYFLYKDTITELYDECCKKFGPRSDFNITSIISSKTDPCLLHIYITVQRENEDNIEMYEVEGRTYEYFYRSKYRTRCEFTFYAMG